MATKKRKVNEETVEPIPADLEPKPETLDHNQIAEAATADDDVGDDEEEDVGELLEPLSRDQLVSLLRSAAASDPRTLAEIRGAAELDPAHRKLFVHGLGWDTTADGLRSAFSQYGDIDECRVVLDKSTGRSKGYGFVLFRHRSSSRRALRTPHMLIDTRMTACQLASAGPPPSSAGFPSQNPNPKPHPHHDPHDNLPRKIYVGNVNAEIDAGRLKSFFARYGEIEEGPLGFDRVTGKPKGFALFVYRTLEGVRRALEEPSKNFEGHQLFCQKADNHKSKASVAATANGAPYQNAPGNAGVFNGSGYGSGTPDMGMVQHAAIMGQGLLGMGGAHPFSQGMQPNAAALAAMLVAAGQNPAAFGINPAMLASLNPAFAAAMGGGAGQVGPSPTAPMAGTVQGYGMGNMGYQNAGFQAPLGFQGPPGFQGTSSQQVFNQGGGPGSYQGAPMVQGSMQRAPMGPSGYGSH